MIGIVIEILGMVTNDKIKTTGMEIAKTKKTTLLACMYKNKQLQKYDPIKIPDILSMICLSKKKKRKKESIVKSYIIGVTKEKLKITPRSKKR